MSMQSILAASQSMVRMQNMQATRTQMQGNANVLRAESQQDGGNEIKDAQAAVLEEKSGNLMGDIIGELTDVNETLKPDEDIKADEVSKDGEASKKSPKTDTVDLSKSATKHTNEGAHEKPVVLDAVTYKADGSTKPSAPATAAKALQATA